jgi:septum formation protein
MTLILASESVSRRAMLSAAGVEHRAVRPALDEADEKTRLLGLGCNAHTLAEGLALAKARSIAGALVLGCDQTLECHDGRLLDKARDPAELASQLRHLSGETHILNSAAAIVENGTLVWAVCDQVKMTMRVLSDAFIADYIAIDGSAVMGCVGGYRIEGRGAQLFAKVEGSQFTVQGLPLLPLLAFLRGRGLLAA